MLTCWPVICAACWAWLNLYSVENTVKPLLIGRVEQIRLREAEHEVALVLSDLRGKGECFAKAEKVVGLVGQTDEPPAKPLTPPCKPMDCLPFSCSFSSRSTVPCF